MDPLEFLDEVATLPRSRILLALDERKDYAANLAQRLGIAKSSTWRHVTQLERLGLVHALKGERKWTYYQLTDDGERVAAWLSRATR